MTLLNKHVIELILEENFLESEMFNIKLFLIEASKKGLIDVTTEEVHNLFTGQDYDLKILNDRANELRDQLFETVDKDVRRELRAEISSLREAIVFAKRERFDRERRELRA